MDYKEALRKIEKIHFFGPHPGLKRMEKLMETVGNPQDKFKAVHVAGTNGKGTTCELIASVLTKSGYKTGLYLSPHVSDFRERMQINCEMIQKPKFAALACKIFKAIDKVENEGFQVTKFEAVTAIALLWFAEEKCDIAVLEVGLGGRFDATNIIKAPLVSVITSISLDHTAILGDTVEKIACEKGGIIKDGRPVVIAPKQPAGAFKVIENIAAQKHSRLVEAEKTNVSVLCTDITGTKLKYNGIILSMPFIGEHQVCNAMTALTVLNMLKGSYHGINEYSLKRGFSLAKLPARLEVISRSPLVIVDGAHNPSGTAALAAALRQYLSGRKIIAVMGMLADKDVASAVNNLLGVISAVVTVAPSSSRAISAADLADCWKKHGITAYPATDCDSALAKAFSILTDDDTAIVVCGSLYLAGDMRGRIVKLLKK